MLSSLFAQSPRVWCMHDYTGYKEGHATMLLQKERFPLQGPLHSEKNKVGTAHSLSAMCKPPILNDFAQKP